MRQCAFGPTLRRVYRCLLMALALVWIIAGVGCYADHDVAVAEGWKHLSSANGELPTPMPGQEQTASLLVDIDGNGVDDIVITERTAAPSVVCLRREAGGWSRLVIDDTVRHIEAGGASYDIDGDGDLDILFGETPAAQRSGGGRTRVRNSIRSVPGGGGS